MRPIELELRYFGQYTCGGDGGGHIIRFDELGHRFLISGKTGAGKTTIFDGIAYALYGSGLGARKGQEGKPLRSEFAGSQDSTVVRLVFEVRGERWEVERSPHHFVRVKRSGNDEIDSYVKLRQLSGAAAPRIIAPADIHAQLQALLVLNFEDFSKILVLPQGEFQQFLAMKSQDRATLLKTLFPVRQHEDIARRAKDEARAASKALNDNLLAQAEAGRGLPEGSAAEALRQQLAEQVAQRSAEAEAASGAQQRADAAAHEAATLAGVFDAHSGSVRDRDAHEAARPQQEARVARLAAGRRAAAALPALDREATLQQDLARLRSQLAMARSKHDEAMAQRQGLAARHAALPGREADCEAARDAILALERRIDELQGLAQARTEQARSAKVSAQAEAALRSRQAEVGKAQAVLDALDAVAAAREAAQPALRAASDAVAACKLAAQDAAACVAWRDRRWPALRQELQRERDALSVCEADDAAAVAALEAAQRRVEADAALLLAATLRDSEPCPVCGATDHPQPRRGDAHAGDALAQRAAAAKHAEVAAKAKATQARLLAQVEATAKAEEAAAVAAQGRLVIAGFADVDAFHAAQRAAIAALQPLEEADKASALQLAERPARAQDHRLAQRAADDAVAAAQTAAQALAAAIAAVAEREARVGIVADADAEVAAAKAKRTTDVAALKAEAEAIRQLKEAWRVAEEAVVEAGAKVATLAEELGRQELALPAVQAEANQALAIAGFADVAALRAAAMAPAALEALQASVSTWDRDLAGLVARVAELERAIAGRARPDVAAAEAAAAQARADAAAASEARQAAQAALQQLEGQQARIAELRADYARIDAETRGLRTLSSHLNGEVAPRIDFATWILTWWLDKVLTHANIRLRQLSDGQYAFRLRTEQSDGRRLAGLDIDILDSWTNKARDVNKISGGEKFMAALSLALGLADVVQARSGGVQLDTLFIDEGFGSLDPDALDKAMELIEGIAKTRSVGLISHVEAMQAAIFPQLLVTKTVSGSSVRLVRGEGRVGRASGAGAA